MEVAPASSEFNAKWGVWDHDVADPQESIGSGKRNTELIIEKLSQLGETGRAAQRCKELNINSYSDWFLPSLDELNLMFVNLHLKVRGGFSNGYWSSSQGNAYSAWGQFYSVGNGSPGAKYGRARVRAVRIF